MRVIGFNFNKISVEKFSDRPEDLKINKSVNIENITETKNEIFKSKENIIIAEFKYSLDYDPNYAKIEMSGNVILSMDPETSKKIMDSWKDSKKIEDDFRLLVFNVILRKTSLKSLELEDELNLPLHINMPSIRKDKKED